MRNLKKIMLTIIAIVVSGYIAICALYFINQRSFIYFPTDMDVDPDASLSFQNDGVSLIASIAPREGDKAVLYFGGNAEEVAFVLPVLAQTFPDSAIYALHYRGYSGSGGSPTERDLVADGMVLFDLAYLQHKNITLIGRSLGSGIAIQVASARPASRLVLVTPYNSILELAQQYLKFLPMKWLLKDKYQSWRYAPAIKIPTTLIAAELDQVVPTSSARKLLGYFQDGVASYVVVPGADHINITSHTEYIPALLGE